MSQASLILTPRLSLRELTLADAPFILELVNEPAFIANIGDKGARDLEGAQRYLRNGPLKSYAMHRHGLWRVAVRDTDEPIGICGPLRREGLDLPDLGYALLARFNGRGYATEAANAALDFSVRVLGFSQMLAITADHNHASQRVLEKCGFTFEGMKPVPGIAGAQRVYHWAST